MSRSSVSDVINAELRKQCVDLKQEIMERWENSVLYRSDYTVSRTERKPEGQVCKNEQPRKSRIDLNQLDQLDLKVSSVALRSRASDSSNANRSNHNQAQAQEQGHFPLFPINPTPKNEQLFYEQSQLHPDSMKVHIQPSQSNQSNQSLLPPPFPLYTTPKPKAEHSEAQMPFTGLDIPLMFPPIHSRNDHSPEPFYIPRPTLLDEMLAHDSKRQTEPQNVMNRVVYDSVEPNPIKKDITNNPTTTLASNAADSNTFTKLVSHKLAPYYYPESTDDKTLVFESRFESGNLRRAIQVYEYEYDLILKPDVNTRAHTQWFYFRVQNLCNTKYKFNIVNVIKPDSLYNQGMKPLLYSEMNAKSGIGWVRCGQDICYYQNNIRRKGGYYYTLTFTVEFPHNNDTCYLAYCYPYTYTDLQKYLESLEQDSRRRSRFRRRVLCQTLAGNACDMLTITSFNSDPEAIKQRKGVVITARVHPGETNSSFMMHGVIDYLTGPSLDAKILRDNFVFKIVPCLNPDGVIVGNYRCSLAGVDLNRHWQDPSRKLSPTIYHTKMMIKRFCEDREVVLYCDFHGHSRKKNVFMYGCENINEPALRLQECIFPKLLSRNARIFSFADCNFKIQKTKEATARVVVRREMNIVSSFTIEASFAGADFGPLQDKHFTMRSLEELGQQLCDAILDYCDPDQSKVEEIMRELRVMYPSGDTSDASSSGSEEETMDENGVKRRKENRRKVIRKKIRRKSIDEAQSKKSIDRSRERPKLKEKSQTSSELFPESARSRASRDRKLVKQNSMNSGSSTQASKTARRRAVKKVKKKGQPLSRRSSNAEDPSDAMVWLADQMEEMSLEHSTVIIQSDVDDVEEEEEGEEAYADMKSESDFALDNKDQDTDKTENVNVETTALVELDAENTQGEIAYLNDSMRVVEADTQRSSQKQKSNANQRQSISSELIEAGKVIVNQSGSRPSITDSHDQCTQNQDLSGSRVVYIHSRAQNRSRIGFEEPQPPTEENVPTLLNSRSIQDKELEDFEDSIDSQYKTKQLQKPISSLRPFSTGSILLVQNLSSNAHSTSDPSTQISRSTKYPRSTPPLCPTSISKTRPNPSLSDNAQSKVLYTPSLLESESKDFVQKNRTPAPDSGIWKTTHSARSSSPQIASRDASPRARIIHQYSNSTPRSNTAVNAGAIISGRSLKRSDTSVKQPTTDQPSWHLPSLVNR